MKINKFAFYCLLLIASIHLPVCQAAQPILPSDVNGIDEDMSGLDHLFGTLQKIPASDRDTLLWLDEKAFALPPLFRYELARRLNVAGARETSLLELARARLGRDIDGAECLKKDRSTSWDVWVTLTNSLETDILNSPRFDQSLWRKSISRALAYEQHRKRTSALWLCGSGNLKDGQSASASRKSAYDFLKADFDKTESKANETNR